MFTIYHDYAQTLLRADEGKMYSIRTMWYLVFVIGDKGLQIRRIHDQRRSRQSSDLRLCTNRQDRPSSDLSLVFPSVPPREDRSVISIFPPHSCPPSLLSPSL